MFGKMREKNEVYNYLYRPTYTFFIVRIANYIARIQTSLHRRFLHSVIKGWAELQVSMIENLK